MECSKDTMIKENIFLQKRSITAKKNILSVYIEVKNFS